MCRTRIQSTHIKRESASMCRKFTLCVALWSYVSLTRFEECAVTRIHCAQPWVQWADIGRILDTRILLLFSRFEVYAHETRMEEAKILNTRRILLFELSWSGRVELGQMSQEYAPKSLCPRGQMSRRLFCLQWRTYDYIQAQICRIESPPCWLSWVSLVTIFRLSLACCLYSWKHLKVIDLKQLPLA